MTSNLPKKDMQSRLFEMECAISTIDKLSDTFPDDRAATMALNGVCETLSNIHTEIKAELLGFDS